MNSEILNPMGNVQLSADQNVSMRELPEVGEDHWTGSGYTLLGAHTGLGVFCFPLATVENLIIHEVSSKVLQRIFPQ